MNAYAPPTPGSEQVPVTRPEPGPGPDVLDSPVGPGAAAVRARRPRRRRRLVVGLLALFGLVTLYYLVCLYQVWRSARNDEARPADAIVVLGAAQYDGRPSPVLAARLDHALALWREGQAPRIVVTGGKRPGDRYTEATASADYLIARGVPDSAILREVQGTSTWESLAATARILRNRGLESVLVVSDPYHSLRARETARELGLDAYASPTLTSPVERLVRVEAHVPRGGRRERGAVHRLPPAAPAHRLTPRSSGARGVVEKLISGGGDRRRVQPASRLRARGAVDGDGGGVWRSRAMEVSER